MPAQIKPNLADMTEKLQANDVQRRQLVVVRCCLYHINSHRSVTAGAALKKTDPAEAHPIDILAVLSYNIPKRLRRERRDGHDLLYPQRDNKIS